MSDCRNRAPMARERGGVIYPLRGCPSCGLVQRIPQLVLGQRAQCARCRATVFRQGAARRTISQTAAAALGAFFLYWPAVLLPILEVQQLGHRHVSSLLGGTLHLLRSGDLLVGLVVLLFSVVLPLAKIVLLLELSLWGWMPRRHRAWTYRVMDWAGKWGMMDVLLLALLVMLVKVGTLVQFRMGPAVLAFVACVVMSLLASLMFDPHAIWEEQEACGGE